MKASHNCATNTSTSLKTSELISLTENVRKYLENHISTNSVRVSVRSKIFESRLLKVCGDRQGTSYIKALRACVINFSNPQ